MIILLVLILAEFFLIYFLSRQIFTLLYTLFFLPTKHRNVSNYIVSFLFFPGTVIHEFSHAIIARMIGVKIGEINLYPHKDKETGEFKAGSIEIEKVDPVRLSLIGIAPSIIGLIIISLAVLFLFNYQLPVNDLGRITTIFNHPYNYLVFLGLFIISMTMFTSKRDIREFLLVMPVVVLFAVLLYYVGFRITLSETLLEIIGKILKSLIFVLGITLGVDLIIYIFLFIPISLLLSLFNKQLK